MNADIQICCLHLNMFVCRQTCMNVYVCSMHVYMNVCMDRHAQVVHTCFHVNTVMILH